ncbi:MAG: Fur family transcriptional regulator [Candidatus Omnitrophota bacterium]|nr:Fur family transcriptional regulator [Candidatus Omnitrophota bacterium]
MQKEIELFKSSLKKSNLKVTSQRLKVLEVFLKTEKHVSCDELYRVIRRAYPEIGYATVYRTLKLIQKTGLAREVDFGDRTSRLEHNFGHEHHDHLICLKCGRFFEVFDSDIERLQEKLARKSNFTPIRHKMDIFGYCQKCK